VGLVQTFREYMEKEMASEALRNALYLRVVAYNYIPKGFEEDYKDAILRRFHEYKERKEGKS
jgi:hypothetical protein